MATRSSSTSPIGGIVKRVAATGLIILAAIGVLGGATPASDAQAAPPITVTVSRGQNLQDGSPVTVHVDTADGVVFGSTLSGKPTARLCNADATPTVADVLGNTPAGTGGCLGDSDTVSSSQVPSTGRFALAISADRRKAETTFVVGTGTTSGQQGPVVQCDEDHTCRLAVAVYVSINGGRGQWIVDSSAVLGFEPPDPLQGCGKPDPNGFSSVGADRLFDAWTRWTRAYCKDPAHPGGAPATATLSGEGDNLSAYEQGQADLAYAASTDPALTGGAASRPSVAVPIGLNAVVMGVGGWGTTDPAWPTRHNPIDGVQLSATDLAGMVGWGVENLQQTVFQGTEPIKRSILDKNPQLDGQLYDTGADPGIQSTIAQAWVEAVGSSTTLFTTRFLANRAPAQWTVPTARPGSQGHLPDEGKARGIFPSFATAKPTVSNVTFAYSTRSDLEGRASKVQISAQNPTPAWFLTNLATASSIGMPVAALQTGRGDYVAPTPDTLTAAVATLKADKNGMLAPDPEPSADAAGAYPLTFVEYAIVPAAPLVTDDCKPRTESQAVMTSWLTYVTTAGQAELPPGMAPLTPALQKQATDAIAKVGTGAQTGKCEPKTTPPTTPAATTSPPAGTGSFGDPGSFGDAGTGGFGDSGLGSLDDQALAGDLGASELTSGSGAAATSNSASTRPSTAAARRAAARSADRGGVKLPAFFGAAPISAIVPPLSLAAVVALTSVAAIGTSGRPLPALQRVGRRVRGLRPGRRS